MAKVINENIVRDFVKALKAERKKPSAYDTTAKVLRVDGDTAWVHIAGGVDETPVKLTVNAEKGDEVQVRVGGGKAWIVGNATAPPTDDKTANIAHKRAVNADNKAVAAKQTAEEADVKADTAKEKADEAIEAVGASITTDTLHYLATSLDSGVTINTPGWTTTVQSMTSTNRYLWTYHTYQKASGQSVNTNPVITGVYGQTGPQGEPGTAGTSITITNIRYAISTTESQPADSSFTYTSVPSVPEGNWLWTRTLYSDNSKVYTKAKQGETGPQGATGDDGVSITAVQPQYNLSTSTSSATGTWSNTLTYETGKYIWTREKITYSNNTVGYSTAIYNEALTSACANAEDALTMAEKIEQHFWTDEDGAHVTEVTQEEYLDDPTSAGGNSLITANGMSIRDGREELAVFSADEIRIGAIDDAKTVIRSGNTTLYTADQVPAFVVDSGSGTSLQFVDSGESVKKRLVNINTAVSGTLSKLANVGNGEEFTMRLSLGKRSSTGMIIGQSFNDDVTFTKASSGTTTKTGTIYDREETVSLGYSITYTAPNTISLKVTSDSNPSPKYSISAEMFYYALVSDAQVKITSDTDINRVLNDMSWNDVLKDGMLDLRTLVEKLLTRAQDLFLVTTETFSYPAISSGSASGARTATFSALGGYYPLGIMGLRTGNSHLIPTRFNLSSRASGSAELTYVFRAVGAVSAGSGYVDILWVKE